MTRVDLHLHSNCSDGSDSITELAEHINEKGIKIFALTDHDTVEGCKEMSEKVPQGVKFIPSVELTCKVDDIKCHILGYNCDYTNFELLKLIEKGKVLRRNKLDTRIAYLKETWGIILSEKELDWLYSRKSVVKTHIANVLVNRGLASDNLSAMKKYIDGCASGDVRFSVEEAVSAIKNSGGIPIWAHPLGGEGEAHLSEKDFLPKLKKMIAFGIQGLECYYSRYNIDESRFLVNCAKSNSLLITGGSDYHGRNKNNIEIGMLNTENISIDNEELTILSLI